MITINKVLDKIRAAWQWIVDKVEVAWTAVTSHLMETEEWLVDAIRRQPTKEEFQILQRLPAGIVGGVITGFFFMAANASAVVAAPVGIILILGSAMVYRWATQNPVM